MVLHEQQNLRRKSGRIPDSRPVVLENCHGIMRSKSYGSDSLMTFQKLRDTAVHILLMLIELPIGILLFTFAVTGLSLSVGLLPLFLLGVPLFIAVMNIAGIFYRYEMIRCYALLREVPDSHLTKERQAAPRGLLNQAIHALTNMDNWKGILLMILKLPLGILTFTIAVVLCSLSLSLLAYPIVYYILEDSIKVDIYETNVLSLFTDLGPAEQSVIYFALGLVVSYAVIRVLPIISKAILRSYVGLLKI